MVSRSLSIGILGMLLLGQSREAGLPIADMSWVRAEPALQATTVVVVPIGAVLQQHGPHLPLRTDATVAELVAARASTLPQVAVMPPLTYHHAPASLEYPGAAVSLETARDLTVQAVRSLARSGPRRFYAVTAGLSTIDAVNAATSMLARDGILLRTLHIGAEAGRLAADWKQQPGGGHADELETSMMLFLDPRAVDMKQATREYARWNGPLTRMRSESGTYSVSGVWGDPTLATREKGQYLVEGLTARMVSDIDGLAKAALPAAVRSTAPTAPVAAAAPRMVGPTRVFECLPGSERDIKRVEAAFNLHWTNRDVDNLAALWSDQGDLVHPDATIEKTRRTIWENRREQFKSPEYKAARHSLVFGIVRCINEATAIVDARWTLRDVNDAAGATLPTSEGAATLVLQRAGENWLIEAYRYHVKPGAPPAPIWQKRPGPPDKR